MKTVEISPYHGLLLPFIKSGSKRAIRASKGFKKTASSKSIIHIFLVIGIVFLSLMIICLYMADNSFPYKTSGHNKNGKDN